MLYKLKRLIRDYCTGELSKRAVTTSVVFFGKGIEFVVKLVLKLIYSDLENSDVEMIASAYCFMVIIFLMVIAGMWQKNATVLTTRFVSLKSFTKADENLINYKEKWRISAYEKAYTDFALTEVNI